MPERVSWISCRAELQRGCSRSFFDVSDARGSVKTKQRGDMLREDNARGNPCQRLSTLIGEFRMGQGRGSRIRRKRSQPEIDLYSRAGEKEPREPGEPGGFLGLTSAAELPETIITSSAGAWDHGTREQALN